MTKALVFFLLAVVTDCAVAEPIIRQTAAPVPDGAAVPVGAVHPNESDPGLLRGPLADAPAGVYVAVGTERGFIGVALATRATRLVLVDRDIDVVRFNQINIVLLAIARDQADYRNLRLTADRATWLARLAENPLPPGLRGTVEALFSDPRTWTWWQRAVRDSQRFADSGFHQAPVAPGSPFHGANYLFDEALFTRLQRLAREGNLEAHQVDLSDALQIARLVRQLRDVGARISALDLSNAWNPAHIETEALRQILRLCSSLSQAETRLILTAMGHGAWDYLWIRLAQLAEGATRDAFIADLLDFARRTSSLPAERAPVAQEATRRPGGFFLFPGTHPVRRNAPFDSCNAGLGSVASGT